jgi:hypothetical protein
LSWVGWLIGWLRLLRFFFLLLLLHTSIIDTKSSKSSESNAIKNHRYKGQPSLRYLLVEPLHLALVEPDTGRMSWADVLIVAPLWQVTVAADGADQRVLTVRRRAVEAPGSDRSGKCGAGLGAGGGFGAGAGPAVAVAPPLAVLSFDDPVRCTQARELLERGIRAQRGARLGLVRKLLAG